MADDRIVTVTIKSEYDGKGEVNAKKGLKDVEKQAKQTTENAQAGISATTEKVVLWSQALNILKTAWSLAGKAANWLWESVEMANKNARAVNMLSAAYQNVGYTAEGALKQAKAFASEMQNLTGIADEAFLDAQRLLANYGVVGAKAQEGIRAAYALSVSQGMSFETALMQIAKAAAGSTASLSRYGIVLGDNVKEGEKFDAVLKQINDKFGASAQAAMGDMTSQVSALKESWGDLREEIGNYLIPVLQKFVSVSKEAISALNFLFNKDRTTDQIAYQKNLERVAQINKEISEQNKRLNSSWYNPQLAQKRIDELNKEKALLESAMDVQRKRFDKEAQVAKVQNEQAEKQATQINNARTLNAAAEERAKKEAVVAQKLKDQLETFRQNAQQSANERKVKFTAEIAGASLSGLSDIDNRLEQEHILQQQLAEVREQALQEQIARAQTAADTETEIGQTRIATALEQLEEFNAEQLILNEEYTQNRLALDTRIEESNKSLYAIQKFLDNQRVKDFSGTMNDLAKLQNSKSKELVAVGKAAGIAQATIDTAQGAIAAYQSLAHIPYVGTALGIAAAAALTAYGAERIAEIGRVKMAEGGLVKAVTGGVPAVVGEGGSDEAVLPLDNANAMRRIGGAIAEESGAGNVILTQNINIQAGESLIPDITNALRNATVDALEMANMTVKVGNSQQGLSV